MKQNIASTARELTERELIAHGFTLWDVRFEKEAGDWNLVFELDRGENMSMTDCEEANGIIEPIIDKADPIEGAYVLEVSSAGLSRILRTDLHFEKAKSEGWNVVLKLFTAVNGKKEYEGVVTDYDGDSVTVNETKIIRKSIAKAIAILG